jgi:hypothetical protein
MSTAFLVWEKQDLGIEAMLDGMIQTPAVTRATVQTLQASANVVRLPDLVRRVKAAHRFHPGTQKRFSLTDAFCAVGLFCGLHAKNVQKLYYKGGYR